ncbi:MAG: hypothetical protein OEZ13_02710 [Spirochaetia bacterium]|nr:hypothetical protein [Spirochaetia bacterium]
MINLKKNNIIVIFVNIILIALISTVGTAQTRKKKNENKNSEVLDYGGAKFDKSLTVSNYSFGRRFASDGKGEYLDLSFDILNQMDEDINLKMYIVGFYQTSKAVSKERKWVGYPEWRKRDLDKEIKNIYHLDSIPKIDKTKIDDEKTGLYEYPSFKEYLKYLVANGDKGIDLKLPGLEGKGAGKLEGKNYNILMAPLKTSVFAKLYTPYGAQQYQFNYLGVILYDTSKNKIVYRQFMKFNKKLKMY